MSEAAFSGQPVIVGDDERAHLYRLARPSAGRDCALERPGLRRLLDSITDVPAYVVGRRVEVLAWNPLAAALIDADRLAHMSERIRAQPCHRPTRLPSSPVSHRRIRY